MSSAKRYMRKILFFQGLVTIAVAATWIWDVTPGRLMGVAWLEDLLGVIPFLGVDDKIGIIWGIGGLIMVAGGSRLGLKRQWIENAAFTLAIVIPLFIALVFLVAFLFSDVHMGYTKTILYLAFIAPYYAYLRTEVTDVSVDTGVIRLEGTEESV